MKTATYRYLIVGAGLAGAAAIEGIRAHDPDGTILLLGDEAELPYDRPPLTKKLWFGQKQVADIYVHPVAWYESQGVQLVPGTEVTRLDPARKVVMDRKGTTYGYEKLLLATGGRPKRLTVPGGDLEGVCYYRYLADYRRTRAQAVAGASAVVIGGGFIGSEIAAALAINNVHVTMIYPGRHLVPRVFPADLGSALQEAYRARGLTILAGDTVSAIAHQHGRFVVITAAERELESDLVIAGIGLDPDVSLAAEAGLETGDGVVVNEYLQTSHPDVYAAGDNALFPYLALGDRRRVEHWDNAIMQGRCAGRNMAGAGAPYDHLPYFFSDLFEFGYEAVGEVDPRLEVFADWTKEYDTGVLYYLADGKVRGAMLCNVWDKVEAARELIRRGETVTPGDLRGAVR